MIADISRVSLRHLQRMSKEVVVHAKLEAILVSGVVAVDFVAQFFIFYFGNHDS